MSDQPSIDPSKAIEFDYVNYKGEAARRRAVPIAIRWGSTQWHPEEQWLLEAHDLDRDSIRKFALSDCNFTTSSSS